MIFLIIGYGSIGQRHAQTLVNLGNTCVVVEPNTSRLKLAEKNGHKGYVSLNNLDLQNKIDGVLICSPPVFHVQQTLWALSRELKIFLEKPIGTSLIECTSVLQHNYNQIFVGYTYRWNPQFIKLQNDLRLGLIGIPYYANFEIGMNLEDWHPWENYRDFFMSRNNLGGGALLDESHFLELAIELFGLPTRISSLQSKISNLDIETDDYVFTHFEYKDLLVDIKLDLFSRPHKSLIQVYGTKGSICCDFIRKTNLLTTSDSYANSKNSLESFDYERQDIFRDMLQDYLKFIRTVNYMPRVSYLRGLEVMHLIEKIRKSSSSEIWEILNDT